jgi:hypothetical protein
MVELLHRSEPGEFLLIRPGSPGAISRHTIGTRRTEHVRHWRKYADATLPPGRGFFFRSSAGAEEGREASNLGQFVEMASFCDEAVLRHHADRSDFSRWIRSTIQDSWLASEVAAMEEDIRADMPADELRHRLKEAVRVRYGT